MRLPDSALGAASGAAEWARASKISLVKVLAWVATALILVSELWFRFPIRTGTIVVAFALICASAAWWDLHGQFSSVGKVLSAVVTPILFLIVLFGCFWLLFSGWRHGSSTWYSAGPLVPYSDASEYVSGAKSLIVYGELGEISARRPLATNLIAVAFWITNQSHQKSLVLVAIITAVATFFAARQTWLAGGLFPAVLYAGLCLLVLTPWIDIFMTERAGYIFSSLSYALLLSAFGRRSFGSAVCGIGFLVLAQAARPGAILAVVFVAGFAVYFFAAGRMNAMRKGVIVVATIISLLVVDSLVSRAIGPKVASYQGNISFSLYGIAVGGKPWYSVLIDHPEVAQLPSDGDQSRYVYGLFWKQLTSHPDVFTRALLYDCWKVVRRPDHIFFGLVNGIPPFIPTLCALAGYVLLARGLIRPTSALSFLPVAAAGVLLSAPFLFDGGVRIYMSIVPFHLGLAVVPAALLRQRSVRTLARQSAQPEIAALKSTAEIVFGVALVAILVFLPIYISRRAAPEALSIAVQKLGLLSDEGMFYFNRESGVQMDGSGPTADVVSVPLTSITAPGHFSTDFHFSSWARPDDYFCHAFLLVHPTGHEDVVAPYLLFDRMPKMASGYLVVRLRLLEQHGTSGLFRVEDFRRLDL